MSLNDIVGSSWKSVRNFVNGVVLYGLLSTGIAYADNTKVPEGGANWVQQGQTEQTCPPNCGKPAKQTPQSIKPIKKHFKKGIRCKESPLPGRNVGFTLGDKKVNGLDYLCWDKKTALRQGYNLKDKIRGTTYTRDPCQRCRGNEYAYRTHAAYCRDQAKLITAESGKAGDKVFYTGSWDSKDKECNFTGSCAHLKGNYKLVLNMQKKKRSCKAVIAPAKCGKDHLALCKTENDCKTATGHFYDNKCNAQQKETQPIKKETQPVVKTPEIQPFISAKTGETGFYGRFGVDHSAVKVKGTGRALTTLNLSMLNLDAIKAFNINLGEGYTLSPQVRFTYNEIRGSQKMEGHNFWLGAGLGLNQTTVNTTKNINNQFEFVGYVQTLISNANRTIINLPDNLGTIHSTLSYTDAWRAGGELRLLIDSKLALELFGEYGRQGQNQFTTLNGAPLSEGAATRNTLQHSELELALQYRAEPILNPTAKFSWVRDQYRLEDGSKNAYDNFTFSLGNEFNIDEGKFRLKPVFIYSTQTGQSGIGLEACIGKNRQFCFGAEYTPSGSTDRTDQIMPIVKGNIQGSF